MKGFEHLFAPIPRFPNDRVEHAVARAYEAMASGVNKALAPVLADDVAFWIRGEPENLPFAGTWTGPQSVTRFTKLYSANVRDQVFRCRYSMLQEDDGGAVLMLFVSEEGIAAPTGKAFESESVHEWRVDKAGRIGRFASWNNSFDFFQAFAAESVDPSLVYRHPLEEALAAPTRTSAADAGAIVERFYRCLVGEDWNGLVDLMAPNVVSTLEGVEGIVPFAGTYRGKDEAKRQALTFSRTEQAVVDNVMPRYVVDGNRACARFDEAGTYVFATGCGQYFTNLHCFGVNDAGLIETFRSYNDTWQVWLTSLPDEPRPAGVAVDLWKRHRRRPDRAPTAGSSNTSTERIRP